MGYNAAAPVSFFPISMVATSLGSNAPELGTRAVVAGNEYVFVYNAGADAQISVGLGATVSATAGYSCTVSTTTQTDMLAGVCKHATIPTGGYGWLLTRGYVQVIFGANNSAAAGERLGLGTDGKFSRIGSSNTDVVLGNVYGKVMSAVASNGSGGAWVKAFF